MQAETATLRLMKAMPPECVPITVEALGRATSLDRKRIAATLGRLARRGLAERRGGDRGAYALTAGGVAARDDGTVSRGGPRGPHAKPRRTPRGHLRDRLWRALRTHGKATIPELLTLAASGEERNAAHNARRYLRALERAGYLVRMQLRTPGTAPTSPGFVKWLLLPGRNSGPRAPVWCPGRNLVRDPNNGRSHELRDGSNHG